MARQKKSARKQALEAGAKLCGVTKQSGQPCLQLAGHGTDHPGEGPCKVHQGTPAGKMSKAGKEIAVMATPLQTDPATAMTGLVNLAAGQLTYATIKVSELGEDDLFGEEGVNVWVKWQERLMDRLSKFASTAAAMGIEERRTRVAEAQTAAMTRFINAVVGELDLSPAQRKKVGPAVRKALPALSGGGD